MLVYWYYFIGPDQSTSPASAIKSGSVDDWELPPPPVANPSPHVSESLSQTAAAGGELKLPRFKKKPEGTGNSGSSTYRSPLGVEVPQQTEPGWPVSSPPSNYNNNRRGGRGGPHNNNGPRGGGRGGARGNGQRGGGRGFRGSRGGGRGGKNNNGNNWDTPTNTTASSESWDDEFKTQSAPIITSTGGVDEDWGDGAASATIAPVAKSASDDWDSAPSTSTLKAQSDDWGKSTSKGPSTGPTGDDWGTPVTTSATTSKGPSTGDDWGTSVTTSASAVTSKPVTTSKGPSTSAGDDWGSPAPAAKGPSTADDWGDSSTPTPAVKSQGGPTTITQKSLLHQLMHGTTGALLEIHQQPQQNRKNPVEVIGEVPQEQTIGAVPQLVRVQIIGVAPQPVATVGAMEETTVVALVEVEEMGEGVEEVAEAEVVVVDEVLHFSCIFFQSILYSPI